MRAASLPAQRRATRGAPLPAVLDSGRLPPTATDARVAADRIELHATNGVAVDGAQVLASIDAVRWHRHAHPATLRVNPRYPVAALKVILAAKTVARPQFVHLELKLPRPAEDAALRRDLIDTVAPFAPHLRALSLDFTDDDVLRQLQRWTWTSVKRLELTAQMGQPLLGLLPAIKDIRHLSLSAVGSSSTSQRRLRAAANTAGLHGTCGTH